MHADAATIERETGIALERYAEISAKLRKNGADATLSQSGIEPERWQRADAAWTAFIDGETARGNHAPAIAFAAAYRKTRAELAAAARPPTAHTRVPAVNVVHAPGAPAGVDTTSTEIAALDDALPFGKSPDLDFLVALAAPMSRASPATGATVECRALSDDEVAEHPSFVGESRKELTLEQYASLYAELEHAPQASAGTLQKYGLGGAEAFAAEQRSWSARFDAEPGDRARFDDLVGLYRRYLQFLR